MKLHVSMKVNDFQAAVGFYSGLFNQPPVILKDDYAKWDVADPAVNFVVEPGEARLDHLGIEAETDGELDLLAERIRESGQPFLDVAKAHCCYANSEKAWVKGSAGEKWEAFLTHSHDESEYGEDRGDFLESRPDTADRTSNGCCI